MSSRTRVPRWTPPLWQALRLAARPAVAYFLFTLGGLAALLGSVLYYNGVRELPSILIGCGAGVIGVVLGMLIATLRARTFPVIVASGVSLTAATVLVTMAEPPFGEQIMIGVVFFCFAFPCGMLALQHRWELVASFWPAVGWIGGVFVIINEEGRLAQWEEDKVTAWLPVPLAFLAGFLILWLFYLSAKQAMRVELWQSLSGAVGRRISKKAVVSAVPRKNLVPMLLAAALLFGIVAALSPYLWRTGKGDDSGSHDGQVERSEPKPDRGPPFDGDAIVQQMKQLAQAAKNTAVQLWPLLLLLLLYRPAKRGLLSTHLLTPIVPAPPTERIDNHWEYVRIAAEDAGIMPAPSDSVEQLLVRVRAKGLGGPALEAAAEIYARTRYGFTVGPGDPLAMRAHAIAAARELRVNLRAWDHVKNLWRPLS